MYFEILSILLLSLTVYVIYQHGNKPQNTYDCNSSSTEPTTGESSKKDIAHAINSFGDDLYKQIAKQQGNIVFSPFSIHCALSALALGSNCKTQAELLSHLYFDDIHSLKMSYASLFQRYHEAAQENILTANGIFVNKRFLISNSYKNNAKDVLEAYVDNIDLNKPKVAAAFVNNWVANKTSQMIPEIMDVESLNSETALIILNAIYFKGSWAIKFNESKTVKDYTFHTPTKDVKCDMMGMRSRFLFRYSRTFEALDLAFLGENINIAFVRPCNEYNKTFAELEENLNAADFFKVKSKAEQRSIFIPKLKIKGSYSLNRDLISIGIADIFKAPDLSNLLEENVQVLVDKVTHKAVVEINEEGVVASAATAVSTRSKSGHLPFTLDGPFIFFIYCKESQTILFKGRVEDPTA